jgi:hypothetical protein
MAKGDTAQRAHTEGQKAANNGEPKNEGWRSLRSDSHNEGFEKGHDSVTEQKNDK